MTPTLALALAHIAPQYNAAQHKRAAERIVEDMEKTAHTPGKWKTRKDNDGITVTGPDGNGQEVCTVVQHTAGPWEVANYEECRRVRGKIGDSRPTAVNVGSYVLAVVWDPATIQHNDDRCRANARLIAASPDLLAACETLCDYFAGHDPNDIPAECGSGVRAALIQARAAIAKAKAGAQ